MMRLTLALLAAVVLLSRCDADNFLSGQWFSRQEMTDGQGLLVPNVPANGTGAWVELNLGHYGGDVVGVIRFYTSPNRLPGDEVPCAGTFLACTCEFVDGRYDSDTETMVFKFPSCERPKPTEPRDELCASLRRVSGDEVAWTMRPCSDASAPPATASFLRTEPESGLVPDDKACTKCQAQ